MSTRVNWLARARQRMRQNLISLFSREEVSRRVGRSVLVAVVAAATLVVSFVGTEESEEPAETAASELEVHPQAVDREPQEPRLSTEARVRELEDRAQRLVIALGEQKTEALSAIRRGHGRIGHEKREGEAAFVQKLDAGVELFLRLHHQHVAAITAGDEARAQDLVSDVQHLLWMRERDIFRAAYAHPKALQILAARPPQSYTDYSGEAQNECWTAATFGDVDTERLARIELAIAEITAGDRQSEGPDEGTGEASLGPKPPHVRASDEGQ